MNIRPHPIAIAITASLACSLLAACGGGGGMVRTSPPPATPQPTGTPPVTPPPPPPPSPPPPRSLTLPTPPGFETAPVAPSLDVTTDPAFTERLNTFRNAIGNGFTYDAATGNYTVSTSQPQSQTPSVFARTQGALTKLGDGQLWIAGRFDGGVHITAGTVLVYTDVIHGNLEIAPGAQVHLQWGDIVGTVQNRGTLDAEEWDVYYDSYNDLDIFGDYTQSSDGTLRIHLGAQRDKVALPDLTVSGTATLDGTLEFRNSGYIPSGGYLEWVLHAREGIAGQFARWTSPGLLLEGNLRYDANNVWLELTRLSVQAAMAGQGIGGITLASAGNLDRALAVADRFARAPNAAQSRFLRSAGRLLWVGDAQQAARSLDSLAGSLHADAMDALARDDALARGIGARTLALQPGSHAGAWARLQGGDTIAGFDQWLSPRLLAGATASQANGLASDTLGGHAQHASPQAALYLRWFGDDGWYAGGSAGYAQHALNLERRIDLADGGNWNAHAQRRLGIASLDAEAGRRFAVGGATLAPYAWLGADAIRSERAFEQGQTGFELALQANTQASLDAGVGLRVGKQWRLGDAGWLALDADARYRQRLAQTGAPLRAAFVGVPDAWFDIPGHDLRSGGWLDLGLRGGFGRGWGWSLGHAGSLAGDSRDRRWQFGLQRQF